MKKKLVSLLLSTALVAGIMSGCGGSGKKTEDTKKEGDKTTLTMWCPPLDEDTEGNFKKLLKGFEEENNVEVEMELIHGKTMKKNGLQALELEKVLISDICMRKCIRHIFRPE